MKRTLHGLLFSAALIMNSSAFAAANRAVEININGIGPAVDAYALKTVRQVIGAAFANGLIDKFNVTGQGIEGGLSACVEVSTFNTQGTGLSAFVRQLRSIRPNPATTAYSVKAVVSCP